MKASLKLEYSLRVLSQLARKNKGGAVTRVEELAKIEAIPATTSSNSSTSSAKAGWSTPSAARPAATAWPRRPRISRSSRCWPWSSPTSSTRRSRSRGPRPQVAALWREVSKRFDKSLTGFTVAQLALTESGTDFEI